MYLFKVLLNFPNVQVMMQDGHVFSCHRDRWDAIWYGELGSSAAILDAGYNIGSFMIRYRARTRRASI